MTSPRDLIVGNILFYCFEDDGLGFITQLNYSSLLEVMFTMYIFVTSSKYVLRVIEKRETSTSEARARDARANRETGF